MASFVVRCDATNVNRNSRLAARVLDGLVARTVTEFRDMVRIARELESEGIDHPRVAKAF